MTDSRGSWSFAAGVSLAALLVLAAPSGVDGQEATGRLTGTVRVAEDGEPVSGVEMVLVESGRVAVTDESGRFVFEGIPPGRYALTAHRLGLTGERAVAVEVEAGETTAIQMLVRSDPVPVPGIEAEIDPALPSRIGGFYRRAERGTGRYITRADIERLAPHFSVELLERVPSMKVRCTQPAQCFYWFARSQGQQTLRKNCAGLVRSSPDCAGAMGTDSPPQVAGGGLILEGSRVCAPLHFLDGTMVPKFDLDDLPPSQIEGIEVYTPSSVPPRFKRAGSDCGVLVIWTRSFLP